MFSNLPALSVRAMPQILPPLRETSCRPRHVSVVIVVQPEGWGLPEAASCRTDEKAALTTALAAGVVTLGLSTVAVALATAIAVLVR